MGYKGKYGCNKQSFNNLKSELDDALIMATSLQNKAVRRKRIAKAKEAKLKDKVKRLKQEVAKE